MLLPSSPGGYPEVQVARRLRQCSDAGRLDGSVGGTLAKMLPFVRFGLPAVIATVAVALVVFANDAARGAGIVLIGVALLVILANLFIRLALSSERDRDREAERRRGP
jgi:hypothetical protein